MARGIAGIEFENSTDVRYVHKSYSVLIQTDRAVYKPGNKVMFRCILLNSGMKPANPKQVEIHVMVIFMKLIYCRIIKKKNYNSKL